jgi:hypothetical protein
VGNLSPNGLAGSWAVLDERTVGYLEFGGSHAETIAHLPENGRVTLMWCAFDDRPKVVLVHGRDDPRWSELVGRFPSAAGHRPRAVIVVRATRISDSCGFALPLLLPPLPE